MAALSRRFWGAVGKGQGRCGSSAQWGTALSLQDRLWGRGFGQPAPFSSAREPSQLLKVATLFVSWLPLPFKACSFFSPSLSSSSQSSETSRDRSLLSPQASLPTHLAVLAPAVAGKWISSHGR